MSHSGGHYLFIRNFFGLVDIDPYSLQGKNLEKTWVTLLPKIWMGTPISKLKKFTMAFNID